MVPFFDAGQHAVGIIAIGQEATGVIAIGQAATGVIAIGQLSRGFFAVGQLAIGLGTVAQLGAGVFWSFGQLTASARARGQVPLSLFPSWQRPKADLPPTTPIAELTGHANVAEWIDARMKLTEAGVDLEVDGKPLEVEWQDGVRDAAYDHVVGGARDGVVRVRREQRFEEPVEGGVRDAAPSRFVLVATDIMKVPPSPLRTGMFWVKAGLGSMALAAIFVAWWMLFFQPWSEQMGLM